MTVAWGSLCARCARPSSLNVCRRCKRQLRDRSLLAATPTAPQAAGGIRRPPAFFDPTGSRFLIAALRAGRVPFAAVQAAHSIGEGAPNNGARGNP